MSDDLVTQLKEQAFSDHVRGCEGRQYSCDCGYDIRTEGLLEQAATALTEARAEIERLRATPLAIENARLQKWIDLHRGDVMSLSGEVEQFRAERDAAQSELSTLRARVREVVGPFADLAQRYDDTVSDGWVSWAEFVADHAWPTEENCRAARQLNEDLK